MLKIKAKPNQGRGFRRCGVHFPETWTEFSDDKFKPEQIAILKKEARLEVQVVSKSVDKDKDEDRKKR
jgi:hypothetical protein